MLAIRWALSAQRDLLAIASHYAAIDPALADEIGGRIVAAATFLSENPKAGPIAEDGGRRKWRVKGTRYRIFYRATVDEVRILRVFHASRRPDTP